jgi:hypothetical protein
MNDLRPQKTGWKELKNMTKEELLCEVRRLDEVLQVTARRLDDAAFSPSVSMPDKIKGTVKLITRSWEMRGGANSQDHSSKSD